MRISQILLTVVLLLSGVIGRFTVAGDHLYITWEGSEADKGASTWLIKRYINTNAEFKFQKPGSEIMKGRAYDVPVSQFRRTHRFTTFESLRRAYKINDPLIIKLGKIIHDMEINTWGDKHIEESEAVEQSHVVLRKLYKNTSIPFGCQIMFFDELFSALKNHNLKNGIDVSTVEACRTAKMKDQ